MPVLTGTPCLVIASRVQVYHSCSVDLTWQRAIHSCQRCPRAVVVANAAVAMAPVTQSNVERTHSRFCPAGVHMSHCIPATELFASSAIAKPQQSTVGNVQKGVVTSGGLNLVPSVWGPPNLPAPAASPHHPVHAANMARASYPPATSNLSTSTSPVPNLVSTQRDKVVVSKASEVKISSDSDTKTSTPISTDEHKMAISEKPAVNATTTSPSVVIVREPQKPSQHDHTVTVTAVDANSSGSDKVESNHLDHLEPAKPCSPPVSKSETSADIRSSNDVSNRKSKKEDSGVSRTPSTQAVSGSDENATPRYASTVVVGEDEGEKARPNKTTRQAERNGLKQQQQLSDTSKDTTGYQTTQKANNISPVSPKDVRDSTKSQPAHQASSIVNGGAKSDGGLGDIGTSPNKPNGVRIEQTRLGSGEHSPKQSMPTSYPSQKVAKVPFHFPLGTTRLSSADIQTELDRAKRELTRIFDALPAEEKSSPDQSIPYSHFGQVAKALNCPLYWKYLVYIASGGIINHATQEHPPVAISAILKMWNQVLTSCPDDAARFVHMMTKGRASHLVDSDFKPLIQDILESHPGLAFLQEAKDFHSRYVATVVARILFNVNSSWSGRISLTELRKSNFLSVLASLEEQDDINLVTQYFSYEHFYVIYCKFWELDEDHDLIINRSDLARHNNFAISDRMVDRIFSGTVTRGEAFKEGVMTYPDFVWFLLAEEDKRHPRSIEYWFRCMDLDGDGLLSMYELEYFYSEQVARMEEMGIEPIAFEDCLCQCLDMVNPVLGDKIRLSDLKQCRLCHIFFDTFFNLPKYLQHEQRDPFANLRDMEEGLNEISDWDRYAAEAYEMLVNIEGPNQEDGVDDDEAMEDDVDEDPDAGRSPSPILGTKNEVHPHEKDTTNIMSNGSNSKLDSSADSVAETGESADLNTSTESAKNRRWRGILVNGT